MEEVEHALPQLEGQREGPAPCDLELLGGLVRLPCRGEEALEVLAVEEVTEQQLPSTETQAVREQQSCLEYSRLWISSKTSVHKRIGGQRACWCVTWYLVRA